MISYQQLPKRCAAIISDSGNVSKLNRIPFMIDSFNEAWLQKLIADHPDLIPSSDIDSSFSPLVCIGREVPVGSEALLPHRPVLILGTRAPAAAAPADKHGGRAEGRTGPGSAGGEARGGHEELP